MSRLSRPSSRPGLLTAVGLLLPLLLVVILLPTPGSALQSNRSTVMGSSQATPQNDLLAISSYYYCVVRLIYGSWYNGQGLSSVQSYYNCTHQQAAPFTYVSVTGAQYGVEATGSNSQFYSFQPSPRPDCIRFIPFTLDSSYTYLTSVQFNPVHASPSYVWGTPTPGTDNTGGKSGFCLSFFNHYVFTSSNGNTLIQELDMNIVNNTALWY